ncbi:TetR/AcrR family transcriptional regulator [Deinococcus misasensis]|uniref:TetR/AcrR family transcriptional regulator n=1 Tax=Deinococcus misasensis TaxID=392413 RepID=UPI0005559B37|nr:TetR/AcrR family transcriptional regulator [Deinococcus misasensis]
MARTVNPRAEKQRRNHIIQAAYHAIYQRGYASVTLADIAQQAGVAKGTLVYYFGSKESLFKEVLKRFVRTIAVASMRAIRQQNTTEDRLRVFVENQFYGLLNTRRFYTVYLDFLSASTKVYELRLLTQMLFDSTDMLKVGIARTPEQAKLMRAVLDGLAIQFLFDDHADLGQYREECLRAMQAILTLD